MPDMSVTFTHTLIIRDGSEQGPGPCLAFEDSPLAHFTAAHAAFLGTEMVDRFDIVDARMEITSSIAADTPTTYAAPDPGA